MRFAIAGLVSVILALVDLPWAQLRAYRSWCSAAAVVCAAGYAASAAAVGVAGAFVAGLGAETTAGAAAALAAAAQGAGGHAALRVALPAGDEAVLPDGAPQGSSPLAAVRVRIFDYLDTRADESMLPILQDMDDAALTRLAIDLHATADRAAALPARRRRELRELAAAVAELRSVGGNDERQTVRSLLRAECVAQGMSRGRLKGVVGPG